jgi:hypothetical protein
MENDRKIGIKNLCTYDKQGNAVFTSYPQQREYYKKYGPGIRDMMKSLGAQTEKQGER